MQDTLQPSRFVLSSSQWITPKSPVRHKLPLPASIRTQGATTGVVQ
jgi:hypothetical protein